MGRPGFSFNDYKNSLAQLSDDELLAVSDLTDDMSHALMRECQAAGPEAAQMFYVRMIDRNMKEIHAYIEQRHRRIEKKLG